MVLVKNTASTGLENTDKEPDVEIPRDILNKMQEWVEKREFDNDDMLDMHRTKEFGDYVVDREHFRGSEDDVTVFTEDKLACVLLTNFLEL